jgi:hypothetical protein
MSEESVTLEFLSRQLRRVIDDIASLKDDMGVLTAMVVRHDQEFGRLNAKLDDMLVRQHQRFSERLRALEEEPR